MNSKAAPLDQAIQPIFTAYPGLRIDSDGRIYLEEKETSLRSVHTFSASYCSRLSASVRIFSLILHFYVSLNSSSSGRWEQSAGGRENLEALENANENKLRPIVKVKSKHSISLSNRTHDDITISESAMMIIQSEYLKLPLFGCHFLQIHFALLILSTLSKFCEVEVAMKANRRRLKMGQDRVTVNLRRFFSFIDCLRLIWTARNIKTKKKRSLSVIDEINGRFEVESPKYNSKRRARKKL